MPTHWLRPSVTPSSPVSRNSPLPTKTSGTSLIPSALRALTTRRAASPIPICVRHRKTSTPSPPDFRPRRTGKSSQALSATSATATPDFFHATFFHGYSNSLFRRQTCSTALKPAFSPILTTRSAVKPQPASVKPSASPSSPCARSKCSRWRGSTRNR